MSAEERKQPPKIGPRRRARECAVQALYQIDLMHGAVDVGDGVEQELNLFWSHFTPEEEASPELASFAEKLVRGVVDEAAAIDESLQRFSQNWRLERMSRVDRNVLRLAVFEMLYADDVPRRVAMNEAIELGKKFGTEESSAFINGILDRIGQEHGLDSPGDRGNRGGNRRGPRGGRGKRGQR